MPSFIVVPLLFSFAQVTIFIISYLCVELLYCIVLYCIAKKEMRKHECASKPFLYTRPRGTGTVRNENVHQKMNTAIGPWKIGAKTVQVLPVCVCYRYRYCILSTRRKREMVDIEYDFGHYEV